MSSKDLCSRAVRRSVALRSIRLSRSEAVLGRTALIQQRSPALFSTRQIAQARAACQRRTNPLCARSGTALCRDRATQRRRMRRSEGRLIKALVAVEPSGAPDPAKVDVGKLKGVPHLIVWGDFRDKVAVWQKLPIAPTKYRDA